VCLRCGEREAGNETRRHLWICTACGHQTSITAWTVMHETQPTLLRDARESEPRRARLIHRGHRTIQLLEEHRHHARRLAAQPLHRQLTGQRVEHSSDRLRLVNIKPHKGHTL